MIRVLVTGVGAIIGYGIVRSCRDCSMPLKVIGTDIYDDAVGRHWCDEFEQAVLTSSPKYPEFLSEIVQRHSIDLVLPGIEQDVQRFANDADLRKSIGTTIALNDISLIQTAADKWMTYCRLRDAELPYIKSSLDADYDMLVERLGLPFLLKPRRSYASKGIQLITSRKDFEYWCDKATDDFLLQQFVGSADSEFTVGLFGYGDGTCSHVLALRRHLGPDGATCKATTVDEPALEKCVHELVERFHPIGPTNMQFRKHDGEYLLLEINPRFSSSHSIRRAFGINDVELCVEYFLHNRRSLMSDVRSGHAVRYIDELVTYDCHLV